MFVVGQLTDVDEREMRRRSHRRRKDRRELTGQRFTDELESAGVIAIELVWPLEVVRDDFGRFAVFGIRLEGHDELIGRSQPNMRGSVDDPFALAELALPIA